MLTKKAISAIEVSLYGSSFSIKYSLEEVYERQARRNGRVSPLASRRTWV
jgi:hypothetical protein